MYCNSITEKNLKKNLIHFYTGAVLLCTSLSMLVWREHIGLLPAIYWKVEPMLSFKTDWTKLTTQPVSIWLVCANWFVKKSGKALCKLHKTQFGSFSNKEQAPAKVPNGIKLVLESQSEITLPRTQTTKPNPWSHHNRHITTIAKVFQISYHWVRW